MNWGALLTCLLMTSRLWLAPPHSLTEGYEVVFDSGVLLGDLRRTMLRRDNCGADFHG